MVFDRLEVNDLRLAAKMSAMFKHDFTLSDELAATACVAIAVVFYRLNSPGQDTWPVPLGCSRVNGWIGNWTICSLTKLAKCRWPVRLLFRLCLRQAHKSKGDALTRLPVNVRLHGEFRATRDDAMKFAVRHLLVFFGLACAWMGPNPAGLFVARIGIIRP